MALLPFSLTKVSGNAISVFELSVVKLMCSEQVFMCVLNRSSSSYPRCQIIKVSLCICDIAEAEGSMCNHILHLNAPIKVDV